MTRSQAIAGIVMAHEELVLALQLSESLGVWEAYVYGLKGLGFRGLGLLKGAILPA